MNKKIKLCILPLAVSVNAYSATSGVNSGSAMTLGPASSEHSTYASSINPASAALAVREGETWRLSYLPSFAFGLEVGAVDNFADDVDELIDFIDDPGTNPDSATETLDRFNALLPTMGEDGYIKTGLEIHYPLAPLFYKPKFLPGTISVDLVSNIEVALGILDDDLIINFQNGSVDTSTSLYLKSGIEQQLAVGYAQQVYDSESGTLYAGAKAKIISLELSKQVIRLLDLDGAEVEDVIDDEYDKNLESSTNIGLDFGVVWDAKWYRAGLTLENINSPTFSYGDVGTNCESRKENTLARSSCEVSRDFVNAGRIKAQEEHTKHALLRADGRVNIRENWSVNGSLDLASYDDVVGFENQWLMLATNYTMDNMWLKSLRMGYQKNVVGTEIDSLKFGITAFKWISADVEYGLSSAEIDGSSAPRKFGFALSVSENF